MVSRNALFNSKEYWLVKIQNELFIHLENYMTENHLNRTQLAEKLGVTKGYVSQILNGDFNHRLSKLIELSLAVGKVPIVKFENIQDVIEDEVSSTPPIGQSQKRNKITPLRKSA
jgi:transcriptional regulator with XRE-family HTH domain